MYPRGQTGSAPLERLSMVTGDCMATPVCESSPAKTTYGVRPLLRAASRLRCPLRRSLTQRPGPPPRPGPTAPAERTSSPRERLDHRSPACEPRPRAARRRRPARGPAIPGACERRPRSCRTGLRTPRQARQMPKPERGQRANNMARRGYPEPKTGARAHGRAVRTAHSNGRAPELQSSPDTPAPHPPERSWSSAAERSVAHTVGAPGRRARERRTRLARRCVGRAVVVGSRRTLHARRGARRCLIRPRRAGHTALSTGLGLEHACVARRTGLAASRGGVACVADAVRGVPAALRRVRVSRARGARGLGCFPIVVAPRLAIHTRRRAQRRREGACGAGLARVGPRSCLELASRALRTAVGIRAGRSCRTRARCPAHAARGRRAARRTRFARPIEEIRVSHALPRALPGVLFGKGELGAVGRGVGALHGPTERTVSPDQPLLTLRRGCPLSLEACSSDWVGAMSEADVHDACVDLEHFVRATSAPHVVPRDHLGARHVRTLGNVHAAVPTRDGDSSWRADDPSAVAAGAVFCPRARPIYKAPSLVPEARTLAVARAFREPVVERAVVGRAAPCRRGSVHRPVTRCTLRLGSGAKLKRPSGARHASPVNAVRADAARLARPRKGPGIASVARTQFLAVAAVRRAREGWARLAGAFEEVCVGVARIAAARRCRRRRVPSTCAVAARGRPGETLVRALRARHARSFWGSGVPCVALAVGHGGAAHRPRSRVLRARRTLRVVEVVSGSALPAAERSLLLRRVRSQRIRGDRGIAHGRLRADGQSGRAVAARRGLTVRPRAHEFIVIALRGCSPGCLKPTIPRPPRPGPERHTGDARVDRVARCQRPI
eukprot:1516793-Rhodomonas_salina.2